MGQGQGFFEKERQAANMLALSQSLESIEIFYPLTHQGNQEGIRFLRQFSKGAADPGSGNSEEGGIKGLHQSNLALALPQWGTTHPLQALVENLFVSAAKIL